MRNLFILSWLTGLLSIGLVANASNVDISLMGGPTWSRLANNQYVNLNDVMTNRYVTTKQTNIEGVWGVGVNYTFNQIVSRPVDLTLGLAAYSASSGKISGTEYPFINGGSYDTLSYKFDAGSKAVMLEPRLTLTKWNWQPYLLTGLGVAWNRLSAFQDEPNGNIDSSVLFSNDNYRAFAYEIGAGVQHLLFAGQQNKTKIYAALDYRYMDFGKGQLGTSSLQTTNEHLEIARLASQALIFSIKFSFL